MNDAGAKKRQSEHRHAVMAADISADQRHVLDRMPDGVLFMDREWRLTYANQQARRISRIRPQDLNGPTHWELYPATVGTEQERKYRRVMEERVEEQLEFFYPPFRIWIHLRAVPTDSGMAVFYQDVTEMRRPARRSPASGVTPPSTTARKTSCSATAAICWGRTSGTCFQRRSFPARRMLRTSTGP